MTDNEIIKALTICLTDLDCHKCPYEDYDGNEFCSDKMLNDVLDIINRQKAEIERLKAELKEDSRVMKQALVLVDEIKKEIAVDIETAKTEAVKEFAERLKEHKIDVDVSFGYGKEVYTEAVAVIEIDNLLKETVDKNND